MLGINPGLFNDSRYQYSRWISDVVSLGEKGERDRENRDRLGRPTPPRSLTSIAYYGLTCAS